MKRMQLMRRAVFVDGCFVYFLCSPAGLAGINEGESSGSQARA